MNDNLGEVVKKARARLGLTQTQLAARIGITASFMNKIEKNEAVPSYERLLALSSVLVVDSTTLIALSQQRKDERVQQRNRTRGAVALSAYNFEANGSSKGIQERDRRLSTAEQIGKEILDNPDLQTAFTWLRTIFENPELKPGVLKTLEVFAKQAQTP